MGPAVGAAVASGGSDLLGSLINNIWGQANQSGQREYNYQMTDYLYSKDLEQWNRQNEYNSPKQQQARLLEAGLNPHLMYGQGTVGNAASSFTSKEGSGPGFKPEINVDAGKAIQTYQDTRIRNAQIDTMKVMQRKAEEEIKIKKLDQILKGFEANLKPEQIKFILEKQDQVRKEWPYDLQAKEAKVNSLNAGIAKAIASANLSNAQLKQINAWLEANEYGVNINRDGFWIRKGAKIVNDFIENPTYLWPE